MCVFILSYCCVFTPVIILNTKLNQFVLFDCRTLYLENIQAVHTSKHTGVDYICSCCTYETLHQHFITCFPPGGATSDVLPCIPRHTSHFTFGVGRPTRPCGAGPLSMTTHINSVSTLKATWAQLHLHLPNTFCPNTHLQGLMRVSLSADSHTDSGAPAHTLYIALYISS